jgi:acetolactate synthase-1/2/3 large subunit
MSCGAEVLLRTLVSNGIDVCFTNPGTSEMQFVAALDRVPGMRGILCLFEGACSGAADGYARMLRRPACTLLHLGPGLANGLANFHNARKARSPIVSIVGEHSTQHLAHDAPLTADVAAFARTVSDHVFYPQHAAELGALTSRAIEGSSHGVSTLIVPADFSWSEAGEPGPTVTLHREEAPEPDWTFIGGPETGLLLSGSALFDRGLAAAARIAAKTGVQVYANRNAARMESGRGRFQPQRVAYFPEPAEAQLSGLRRLILVEAKAPVSFFGYPGRRSTLAPEDCSMLTLATPLQDGAAALEALAYRLGAEADARAPAGEPPELPRGAQLNPHSIGQTVAALLPDNAIVSDETISAGEATWPWLLRSAPHDHLPVTGGSIGQGLPAALGAAVACPDRKVVVLEADGSAMYTLQALWTMAREQLDVVTVVYANRRYRILEVEMKRTGANGFGPKASDLIDIGRPNLDFVKMSEGMGVEASRATTADEFIEQFGRAMRTRGPRLIEAVID